jgi:hypothetical protein
MPLLGWPGRNHDGWDEKDEVSFASRSTVQEYPERGPAPLFPECANLGCASGRLHLWRHRRTPVIEGGWVCSSACALERMRAAVRREFLGHASIASHTHRVPLGLMLLRQGWIDHAQLKRALHAQREGDPQRIGGWLMQHCGLPEQHVTQALSLQWNCPVFSGDPDPRLLVNSPIPRILLEAFGVIPLRYSTNGALYLAAEDRVDHVLSLALERMTGQRVEAGLLSGSDFRRHRERMLAANFPRIRLMEAASAEALSAALAGLVEKLQPMESRLIRVHQFLWFKMWRSANHTPSQAPATGMRSANLLRSSASEDVVCSIAPFAPAS